MDNINILENNKFIIDKKHKPFIYFYITIVYILIIILIIFITNYKYDKLYQITGQVIVEENSYYIKTYIPIKQIEFANNDLIYQNKKIDFKIKSISQEYILDENMEKYYEVEYFLELEKTDIINNNIIKLYIIEYENTIYKKIIQFMKGMMYE